MGRHAEVGYRLLSGSSSELLNVASTSRGRITTWTGPGAPWPRCRGDPLEGRIAAIADVFDALTTDRLYRRALPVTEAIELMRDGRGTQFDPLVLDLFFEVVEEAAAMAADDHFDTHELGPPAETLDDDIQPSANGSPAGKVRMIDGRKFKRACRAAEHAFERAEGRRSIEVALETLADGFEQRLLASVYSLEHGRLWLVAQHGHHEVSDGFALEEGVLGRAVRTGTIQVVGDVRSTGARRRTGRRAVRGRRPDPVRGHGDRSPQRGDGRRSALAVRVRPRAARGAPRRTPRGGSVISRLGCGRVSSVSASTPARCGGSARSPSSRREPSAACCSSIPRSSTFAATTRLSHAWRASGVRTTPSTSRSPAAVLSTLDGQHEPGPEVAFSIVETGPTGLGEVDAEWIVSLPLRVAGVSVGAITGRLSGHEPRSRAARGRDALHAARRCPDRRRSRPAPRAAGRGHRPVDRVAQPAGVRGALPGRAPAPVPGRAADGDHHLRTATA